MSASPLKTELHHWWPRSLAKHWSSSDGMVSTLRPTGELIRAPAGAFGATTNAHAIKLESPWDASFETIFNQPDSEISNVVSWLSTLETSIASSKDPIIDRIRGHSLPEEKAQQLARVAASLLARSPCIRNSIKLAIKQFRSEIGLSDNNKPDSLIAANQHGLYDAYRKTMENRGRWAILFSEEREFITGDGFLHNFPASQDGINSGKKLLLPLLPTAMIVYMLPVHYPTDPRLVTLRATASEVDNLNEFTQIYASNFLFYRDHQPDLTDAFRLGRHQILKFGGDDWLDPLLDNLSQYNFWGEGGAPTISGDQPYTEALNGNRILDSFVAADNEG